MLQPHYSDYSNYENTLLWYFSDGDFSDDALIISRLKHKIIVIYQHFHIFITEKYVFMVKCLINA